MMEPARPGVREDRWIPVIGLEVHVQLATRTKLFSPAPLGALGAPNTRVHAIDLGLPGVLPTLNRGAVALAIRAALALDGELQPVSCFARKNYFYPDLPKGYQITQYEHPFCRGGRVPLAEHGDWQLNRIHLEEDAGKLTHTATATLVDLNRAGMPLIEIVSEPELRSPEHAAAFLTGLREILRYADVSECEMELGSLRCDANLSCMRQGAAEFGTKVELKNLNSIKMVRRALAYEQARQTGLLAAGGAVAAETRTWNDTAGRSSPMRSKETVPDYRYLPEPDLPPLVLDEARIAAQRDALGELPTARRERYRTQFALPAYDAGVLTQDRGLGDWFEAVVATGAAPKAASNWIMTEVLRAMRDRRCGLGDLAISPARLAELIALVEARIITRLVAHEVLVHMLDHAVDANAAVAALDLGRVDDPAALRPLVAKAIEALPGAARDVRAGRPKPLDALKGHVMRATRGRADPHLVDRLLREHLGLDPE